MIATKPPTLAHLSRMYYELALLGARAVGEKRPWPYASMDGETLFTLACEMSRHDPRLFGILVEFLYFHWRRFNPLHLRDLMHGMRDPQTLLVASGFVATGNDNGEFHFFHEYLSRGYAPVATQLYFKNLYAPGSHNMRRAAEEGLQEFMDWGFLARERPVIHDGQRRKILGHWGPMSRRNIIARLSKNNTGFSLGDYLEAVDHTISRQQALLDLKGHGRLTLRGKGRGSIWGNKKSA